MNLIAPIAAFSALAFVAPAAAQSPKAGEIRVLITDANGKSPDLAAATAIIYLEPAGGRRQTLKTTLAKAGSTAPKGVQWRETPKWRVGVQFAAEGEAPPDAPHFSAPFPAESYACPMKDSAPQEKPGKCPKCGMDLELGPAELDAIVVLRLGGETKSVRGFHHPPEEPPATYADGLAAIESVFADFERLVAAGKHDAAHPLADRLTRLAAATAATGDAPKNANVAATAKAIGELAEALDEAEHYGTPEEVKGVMARYREAVAALRAHSKP